MDEIIDITPEESVVPVYLAPLTVEEEAERETLHEKDLAEEQRQQQAKESALIKLAKLGLTEEEARAVIGL